MAFFKTKLFSDGSSLRKKEEQSLMFFRDFLEEIEGDSSLRLCTAGSTVVIVASSFFTSVGTPDRPSLEDVMMFATGSKHIPRMENGVLDFGCDSSLPMANTCGMMLTLPTCHTTYEDFAKASRIAFSNPTGFGLC